jgi:membrane protease YdiL (CAAX protease family)
MFFVISLGLVWVRQALIFFGILNGSPGLIDPGFLLAVVAGWSPTIAALVLTAVTEGRPGLGALWRRFWRSGVSLKWVIVSLAFIPAVWLVANTFTRILGGWDSRLFDRPELFIGQFAVAFVACLGEEFGWRGYVLPRLQVKWNALASSLVLGLLWATWHARYLTGAVLDPLLAGNPPQPEVWEFLIWIITSSVFTTWIFNNANGSILAAVLFHTSMNAGSYIFWCCNSNWHWPAALVAVAILIVILFGPKNLTRQGLKRQSDAIGLHLTRASTR